MSKFNVNSALVEEYVEEVAKKVRVKSFYPQTVSRKLNISLEIVLIELSTLVQNGKLNLKYEVRCLEDLNTIETIENYQETLGTNIHCEICGENIKVEYGNIYPVYYIDKEYREFVKKK